MSAAATCDHFYLVAEGDPDPISAGTAGEAALWGGSSAVVGMAANPLGAHQVSHHTVDPREDPSTVRRRVGRPAASSFLPVQGGDGGRRVKQAGRQG